MDSTQHLINYEEIARATTNRQITAKLPISRMEIRSKYSRKYTHVCMYK